MAKGQQKLRGKKTDKILQLELFGKGQSFPNWEIEDYLEKKGFKIIAGCDDAGRGPLAGPVYAACVVFKKRIKIPFLNDSKKLSSAKRNEIYEKIIKSEDIIYSVGISTASEIDKINILNATKLAMKRAFDNLKIKADALIIDGDKIVDLITNTYQKAIVKGDMKSYTIAAASIIAKVLRDRWMFKISEKYPQYEFERHKGYGTKRHIELIKKYGPCDIHRKTFEPIKSMVRCFRDF